jgi:hypothetical protein
LTIPHASVDSMLDHLFEYHTTKQQEFEFSKSATYLVVHREHRALRANNGSPQNALLASMKAVFSLLTAGTAKTTGLCIKLYRARWMSDERD